MPPPAPERRFKLVVLGTTGVGKTCLTLRFVKGIFDEEQLPTIGAAYMTKKIAIPDKGSFVFEIWDTAGQERYEAITPLYYRSAQAAVIVFDVRDDSSFQKAKDWLSRLRKELGDPTMPIALAANKADAKDSYEVDLAQAQAFADDNGLTLFETSAKSGQNVDEMFAWIATALPDADDESSAAGVPVTATSSGSDSQCCA